MVQKGIWQQRASAQSLDGRGLRGNGVGLHDITRLVARRTAHVIVVVSWIIRQGMTRPIRTAGNHLCMPLAGFRLFRIMPLAGFRSYRCGRSTGFVLNLTSHHAYGVRRDHRWRRLESIPRHAPASWFRLRTFHIRVHSFFTFSLYNI
jgi:hypothetical protein